MYLVHESAGGKIAGGKNGGEHSTNDDQVDNPSAIDDKS